MRAGSPEEWEKSTSAPSERSCSVSSLLPDSRTTAVTGRPRLSLALGSASKESRVLTVSQSFFLAAVWSGESPFSRWPEGSLKSTPAVPRSVRVSWSASAVELWTWLAVAGISDFFS